MTIDLFHNKIIKDNMSDAFKMCVYSELLPLLADKYGTTLLGVQMYEDCLDLNFTLDGEFYYPLTLVFEDGQRREWIKWSTVGKRRFADGNPFAYIGEDAIGFALAERAPDGFEERLSGHAMYFEGGLVPLKIDAPTSSKTLLVGKYSQTFIDEMTRQLSREIESTFSVTGIADSGVELLVVFAPGTYMEHRQDNVTYRRLLISARACAARDLWIKWTRLDGGAPYTVTDNVTAADIKFELGEDVSQKIREKEYRFLVATSPEKYQSAMGRRNITEWRDMIKRVIKRGELKKVAVVKEDPERMGELTYKLQEVLTGYTAPTRTAPSTDNSDINALLRSVISSSTEEKETAAVTAETAPEVSEPVDLPWETAESAPEAPASAEEEPVQETISLDEAIPKEPEAPAAPAIDEAALRRQIEAEVRAQLALEAQRKAEEEAEALRLAHEKLREENEKLEDRAREAEDKLAAEAERIAENERLRAELESLQRAEAREKERMAEAARLALIEQKRLEAERAAEEKAREREAEAAREAARVAEAEALKIAAQREEAERIARLEAERRLAAERAAEEARRAEAMRIEAEARAAAERERQRAEEAERQRAEEAEREARAAAEKAQSYTYVSKNVRLLFKRPVDPNITKRIHEIILSAITYFHKENVFMKVKATVPDATTVNLHFVKFPEEEHEFLVNIIKVLGKSELGITKVFLE